MSGLDFAEIKELLADLGVGPRKKMAPEKFAAVDWSKVQTFIHKSLVLLRRKES